MYLFINVLFWSVGSLKPNGPELELKSGPKEGPTRRYVMFWSFLSSVDQFLQPEMFWFWFWTSTFLSLKNVCVKNKRVESKRRFLVQLKVFLFIFEFFTENYFSNWFQVKFRQTKIYSYKMWQFTQFLSFLQFFLSICFISSKY